MLHLRCVDTKGNDPKCPVYDRVAVPLHTGYAQKGAALLRPDVVHNDLPLVGHAKVLEAKVAHALLQLQDLGPRVPLQDEGFQEAQFGPVLGSHVVATVIRVQLGCRGTWFASTRTLKAWGDVTSWTSW